MFVSISIFFKLDYLKNNQSYFKTQRNMKNVVEKSIFLLNLCFFNLKTETGVSLLIFYNYKN